MTKFSLIAAALAATHTVSVAKADTIVNIAASNGVIHVIDKVLIPGARPYCH